eukprot:3590502-Rhodomonas_salina.3
MGGWRRRDGGREGEGERKSKRMQHEVRRGRGVRPARLGSRPRDWLEVIIAGNVSDRYVDVTADWPWLSELPRTLSPEAK